jgi:uncharacterized membrane protein
VITHEVARLVAAVNLCGEQLAQHFPPGALNPNELSYKVVEI